ncbi:putative cytochrome P450 [Durotheca rogersii]|uniref:putative cytochrome P450 n=1 Tax=Durotheca rogersii TaxID=419775 RepID=UPI00221E70AC|nr:putative cytochrome P450 [Durotheca rogersii]KAI5866411.1 putative cytochrome P450 [Durotheca rogersii]
MRPQPSLRLSAPKAKIPPPRSLCSGVSFLLIALLILSSGPRRALSNEVTTERYFAMTTLQDIPRPGGFTTLLLLLLTYPLVRGVYNLTFHPLAKVPGPRTWSASRIPFVLALLRGTIVHDIERLHRKYGPILRIAPNEVTFAQSDAWDDIFQLRQGHQQFLKHPVWWKSQPGMPQSLISAIDPEAHSRIRKILMPGFTPRALRNQEPILHRYVNLLVERLRECATAPTGLDERGVQLDVAPWFNFTTFDIFGDLGFGESFDCLQHSRYHPWIALLFNSVKAASFVAAARFYPLVEFLLMKCIPPSLRKMQRDHYQQIVDKVQRRLNFELERPDIMSHVITANEGGQLPIGVINTTFMVLTTAGSETTATVLCGALNYLVHHRDKMDLLQKEIRGRFSTDGEIRLDALRNLSYLNAVINEALRLCPPIPWMLPRQVPRGGDTVCGIWLPGGTPVSIQAYTMNRTQDYFHHATSFLPERWLPEAYVDPTSLFFQDRREAVQPFSVGPRSCMGQHLAWAEMRLVLAKLLWTFDFSAAEGTQLRWEDLRTFLLVEKRPIEVRIELRNNIPR